MRTPLGPVWFAGPGWELCIALVPREWCAGTERIHKAAAGFVSVANSSRNIDTLAWEALDGGVPDWDMLK